MITTTNVASSSTAAVVSAAGSGSATAPRRVKVCALAANSAPVFLGGSDVTTGSGLELAAGETETFELHVDDALYVISAAAQNVRVLTSGV